jgi:hypothetical protein
LLLFITEEYFTTKARRTRRKNEGAIQKHTKYLTGGFRVFRGQIFFAVRRTVS